MEVLLKGALVGFTIVRPTTPVMSPRPPRVKVMFSLVRGRAKVPARKKASKMEVEFPLILTDDWEEFLLKDWSLGAYQRFNKFSLESSVNIKTAKAAKFPNLFLSSK